MSTMSASCDGWVFPKDGLPSGHPCHYPGKIEVGGKWYCGVHDPIRWKARADAYTAAHEAERAARWKDEAIRKREQARKLALWPEIIETLEDIVSDVGGGPGRSLPNEIAHDSGLADQAAFARPLLAKMKGAK